MKQVSWLLVLVLATINVAGAIEDPTLILSSEEKTLLEQATPDRLCVTITREATIQTTLRLFRQKEKECDVLMVYSDHDKKIRVAQPEQKILLDDEIKKAVLAFEELRQEKEETIGALYVAVETLAQSLAQAPRGLCEEIKDGVCDSTCRGVDLDCLCGNGVCEYFEHETCAADCQRTEWLCAVVTNGVCSEACLVRDIDCRFAAARDRMREAQKQSGISPSALIPVLALLVMALCGLLVYVLHRRWVENRKAVSYMPSKIFLYLFTLVVLTIGMGLFFVVADRTATTDTTASPGASYASAVYRVLHSPVCFAHVDPDTKTPEQGLIDLTRFTPDQLRKCFMVPPDAAEKQCLKLELYDYRLGEKKLLKEIQTTNFAQCATVHPVQKEPFSVRLFENNQVRPGLMVISAQKRD